jgi:hypothetical protein
MTYLNIAIVLAIVFLVVVLWERFGKGNLRS